MTTSFGKLVLFGSGETSPTGVKIHRKVLQSTTKKKSVAILETPAGFQPNSFAVAKDIADVFERSLSGFVKKIDVIPARKKGTPESPDNEHILTPLSTADYIFLGPGSPTYVVLQLKESKALDHLLDTWQHGATLVLSSAATIAFGEFCLPVYEIFKVGADLYWETGLNFLQSAGLNLTIIPHWNNTEGGKTLDTTRCFMGANRFKALLNMLPAGRKILGIDEQTAIIFDFVGQIFTIEGTGSAHLIQNGKESTFIHGKTYELASIEKSEVIMSSKQLANLFQSEKKVHEHMFISELSKELQELLEKRKTAKEQKDYKTADSIREAFHEAGYRIEDEGDGEKIYKE